MFEVRFKYIQSTVEVEVWYDVDTFCDCSVLSSGEGGGGGGDRGEAFPPNFLASPPSPNLQASSCSLCVPHNLREKET